MSTANTYPYKGKDVTVEEIRHLCYPVAKLNWIQTMLKRGHSVEYIIGTDATKETLKGRQKGIENRKKSNIPFVYGKQYN